MAITNPKYIYIFYSCKYFHSIEKNQYLNELVGVQPSKLWGRHESAKQPKYFIPVVGLSLLRLSKKQDWAVTFK